MECRSSKGRSIERRSCGCRSSERRSREGDRERYARRRSGDGERTRRRRYRESGDSGRGNGRSSLEEIVSRRRVLDGCNAPSNWGTRAIIAPIGPFVPLPRPVPSAGRLFTTKMCGMTVVARIPRVVAPTVAVVFDGPVDLTVRVTVGKFCSNVGSIRNTFPRVVVTRSTTRILWLPTATRRHQDSVWEVVLRILKPVDESTVFQPRIGDRAEDGARSLKGPDQSGQPDAWRSLSCLGTEHQV
ncbi:hypothetical protein EJ06DRAFT_321612 [Trichodelitschia bisporula]|uniref:Uncharacterized protein n=1 Tax=Trichodelitschia bisporula TaxID=703511 RepID=A0A6G1I4V9_9PEZI|nr:hypothetical protein EJ06DRAFT_321612 [Trichodelitschia bisporula]